MAMHWPVRHGPQLPTCSSTQVKAMPDQRNLEAYPGTNKASALVCRSYLLQILLFSDCYHGNHDHFRGVPTNSAFVAVM